MKITKQRVIKRFLLSPRVIVAEILLIILACILGAAIPQAATATDAQTEHLQQSGPVVSFLVDILALDHVFKSIWFLCLTLFAFASLAIVVGEQVKRLRTMWSISPSEAQFRNAPFCVEFDRPATLGADQFINGSYTKIETKGKLGLAGSLFFHMGILMLIVAGALRAMFAVDAVVDLMEGETLPTTVQAWGAQWQGVMARPLKLDYPVTLDKVNVERYESGALKDLSVLLSVENPNGVEKHQVAINKEFKTSGGRLFLGNKYGPTALIEWQKDGSSLAKDAVILESKGNQIYEASASGPDGLQGHLRAFENSSSLEMRVMKDNALLFVGRIGVGETIQLPKGQTLLLHGLPLWARIHASNDPALWLAYLGFTLGLIGSAIIFFLVKIDTCVIVTPGENQESVFVALRVQRFAPLYEHRFKKLVLEQGGTV